MLLTPLDIKFLHHYRLSYDDYIAKIPTTTNYHRKFGRR